MKPHRRGPFGTPLAALALCLAAGVAWAGGSAPKAPPGKGPAKPPAPAPAAGGTVSGIVTDGEGAPVAGASIEVTCEGSRTPAKATSDAKGFYAVRGLPAGKASVVVRARGRVTSSEQVTVPATGLAVADAKLPPGVRYTGRVVNLRGEAVEGARVTARRSRPDDMELWFSSAEGEEATSAKDGAFAVDGLEPRNKYDLKIEHRRYLPATMPGLDATAGGSVTDLEVLLEDAAWVSGTVVDPTGKPVPGARVRRPDEDEASGRWVSFGGFRVRVVLGGDDAGVETDAKGRFELGSMKPPEEGETYVVHVHARGWFPGEAKLTGLAAGKELAGVTVTLKPGTGVVSGVVVDDRGEGVVGAQVDAADAEGESLGGTKTGAGGAFRLERLATTAAVHLEATAYAHEDGATEKVALDAKDAKVELKRLGRLRVRVLDPDGKPVPKVRVRTFVEEDGKNRPRGGGTFVQDDKGVESLLPLGEVDVKVEAEGFEPADVGSYTVEPGQSVDGGEVRLQRAAATSDGG